MATPTLSRRDRRRAATVQEILDAAERRLNEGGVHSLSLRAIARDVGLTPQALYYYFSSRDDLVTALVARAHDALADAVDAAHAAHLDDNADERLLAMTQAYREWAVTNPTRFGIAYGLPMTDYSAPAEGPTVAGPRRVAAAFTRSVFEQWTPDQVRAVTLRHAPATLTDTLRDIGDGPLGDLPPGAAALVVVAWGRMHGPVALEVFGHLGWVGSAAADLFTAAMRQLVDDLARVRDGARPG